ncbi:MAG: phosphoribosylformylglycinamidine synthase subunit PurS [Candidatus Manganitrophaceae bacterium]
MRAKVYVTLKGGILDPQGKAIEHALSVLGFKGVEEVRVGKYLELTLAPGPVDQAEKSVKEMCEKLLANTVIETYRYEFDLKS